MLLHTFPAGGTYIYILTNYNTSKFSTYIPSKMSKCLFNFYLLVCLGFVLTDYPIVIGAICVAGFLVSILSFIAVICIPRPLRTQLIKFLNKFYSFRSNNPDTRTLAELAQEARGQRGMTSFKNETAMLQEEAAEESHDVYVVNDDISSSHLVSP